MRVSRLDLGADVVHLPSRDLLVIHPDLDYAESLGAVMGTLPGLHPDVAVSLVEQVTPRPHRPSRMEKVGQMAGRAAVSILLAVFTAFTWGSDPAAAAFGPTWAQEMESMGMVCQPPRDGSTTCTSADRRVVLVEGYRRRHATLYLIYRGAGEAHLLVFDTTDDAIDYALDHPERDRAGRVVIW